MDRQLKQTALPYRLRSERCSPHYPSVARRRWFLAEESMREAIVGVVLALLLLPVAAFAAATKAKLPESGAMVASATAAIPFGGVQPLIVD